MQDNKKKRIIQIVSVLVIILIIGTIFVVKKTKSDDTTAATGNQSGQEAGEAESTDKALAGLEADGPIDMEAAKAEGKPMIIFYSGTTCGPCKQFKPTIEKIYSEYKDKAFLRDLDVWKYQGAQGDVPVNVVPSQSFWNKDGTPYQPTDEEINQFGLEPIKDDSGNLKFTIHQGGMTYDQLKEILTNMGA